MHVNTDNVSTSLLKITLIPLPKQEFKCSGSRKCLKFSIDSEVTITGLEITTL